MVVVLLHVSEPAQAPLAAQVLGARGGPAPLLGLLISSSRDPRKALSILLKCFIHPLPRVRHLLGQNWTVATNRAATQTHLRGPLEQEGPSIYRRASRLRATHGGRGTGPRGSRDPGPCAQGCASGSTWRWGAKVQGGAPGWEEWGWAAGDPLKVKASRAGERQESRALCRHLRVMLGGSRLPRALTPGERVSRVPRGVRWSPCPVGGHGF